jgi:hypothetical protein
LTEDEYPNVCPIHGTRYAGECGACHDESKGDRDWPKWWESFGIDLGLRPLHWALDLGTATRCIFGHVGPFIFWFGW